MIIHKITHSVDYNWLLNRMDTQFYEPTNQKSTKMLSQQIRKRYYKTLGTVVLNSSMSPLMNSTIISNKVPLILMRLSNDIQRHCALIRAILADVPHYIKFFNYIKF